MKIFYFMLLLLTVSIPLFADEIFMTDNTVLSATVTNVTADMIEYTAPDNAAKNMPRVKAEKIVYSSGKEIEFYDKIFMKDGSVLKGRIIKKSEEYVEYNPAGQIPYDKIETSAITRVLYEDGKADIFNKSAESDLIYFKDGKIVKASGIIVNPRDVEYTDENNAKQFYGRNMIEKIVYKDGRTDFLTNTDSADNKIIPGETGGPAKIPNSFLELEWGWNGYAGLGARIDYNFFGNFSINGAAGLGLWGYGYRFSGALRYYTEYPYGLAFSLGAAYNVGGPLESDMDTEDETTGESDSEKVEFDCKPVVCINASVLYSIQVNGNDKIYIETGYSYALQKEKYTYKTESGRKLTKESEDFMDFISPGGFMISAGYAIAF